MTVTASRVENVDMDPAIGARLPYLSLDVELPLAEGSEVATVLCAEADGRNQVGALVLRSVLPATSATETWFDRFEERAVVTRNNPRRLGY